MTGWYSSSWKARSLEYGEGGGFPPPFSYATKQSGGDKTHRPPDTAVRLRPTKQPVCFTTERAVCDTREKKQPHLSQRQLALAVDITNASLSSIESGMIFPSEELLLKLIEQLQPPPELREKMLALFAKAKGTSPPDINAELSKNPKLWGLIRQLIAVDPSEEQITQIEQLIYAGISASGGTTNDIE